MSGNLELENYDLGFGEGCNMYTCMKPAITTTQDSGHPRASSLMGVAMVVSGQYAQIINAKVGIIT